MYGLEKRKAFEFDLEVDIKKHPKKAKETFAKIESNIQEIKKALKEGKKGEEAKELATYLQGYHSLEKVLKTAIKS